MKDGAIKLLSRLAWTVLWCVGTACSSVSVGYDFDPGADFGKLHSWAFAPAPKTAPTRTTEPVSSLALARIRSAIESELAARGYPSAESPSFLVAYDAAIGKRIDSRPSTTAAWGGAHVATGSEVYVYDEGTLIIDILDPESESLLWRGTARGAVHADSTPEERDQRIRAAVKEMLDHFPPR